MNNQVMESRKSLKEIGAEITQEENRLEELKEQVQKATQSHNALLATITQKTSDFDAYIGQRDAEVKKAHADILIERDRMQKDKEEFQKMLKQHKENKEMLEDERRAFEIQKLKQVSATENVQNFIQAVRRASGLLGI